MTSFTDIDFATMNDFADWVGVVRFPSRNLLSVKSNLWTNSVFYGIYKDLWEFILEN